MYNQRVSEGVIEPTEASSPKPNHFFWNTDSKTSICDEDYYQAFKKKKEKERNGDELLPFLWQNTWYYKSVAKLKVQIFPVPFKCLLKWITKRNVWANLYL